MLIVGLIVGPLVGLILVEYVLRSRGLSGWTGVVIVALVLIFILFAGFLSLELRLGLLAGVLLGVLLSVTPLDMARDEPTI